MDSIFTEYILASLVADPELVDILIEYGVVIGDYGLLELLYNLEFDLDYGLYDAL